MISLIEAIGKMSLLPARRLEGRVPGMRFKGRLQVGCDADIVVFDAGEISDRATYTSPSAETKGVRYLLVKGKILIDKGVFQEEVYAGEAVRGGFTKPHY